MLEARASTSATLACTDRIQAALDRLRDSRRFKHHNFEGQMADINSKATALMRSSQQEALSPSMRTCALDGCGAHEVHKEQFKLCRACRAVVYCCKAHQAEHWPAHKKACKAARRAAEAQRDGGASGSGEQPLPG